MSFWKLAPYIAGGAGMAALENQVLGSNLPGPMKTINLGIGATTGAMLGSPSEASRVAALGSIPLKQMALYGVSEAEKFKNQQEALTDTNLDTARTNESAAKLHLRDAGTSRAIQLSFLIPALVGAGALGYGAYENYKKTHKPKSTFKNLVETGEHKPNQRLKLEMPVSALPDDFVSSLLSARDRSHVTVRGRRTKAASTLGNTALNIAGNLTGIPEFLRGGKDLLHSYGAMEDSDYGDTARYLGAGLGNIGVGLAGLRWGAMPLLAGALGKARLRGVIRNAVKGESDQLREFPTVARSLYRHEHLGGWPQIKERGILGGHVGGAGYPGRVSSYLNETLPNPNAYDPMKYDWKNPTTGSSFFKGMLTAPAIGAGPRSLLDTIGMGVRYAGNRAVNAGYAGRQLMRRFPNVSMFAAGLPLQHQGVYKDEEEAAQQKAMWDKYLPQGQNMGPMGMPVSSVANSIIRAMSGSPEPISRQLSGI